MTQPKLAKLSLWGEANAWDEARAYRHPHTGVQYPSVTSILRMADKGGLSQWAADQAMLWAVDNVDKLMSSSPDQGMRAGRYRWKDVRDERARVGDNIHNTLEALNTGSWNFPPLNEEEKAVMEHWRQLNTEHEIESVLSEFTVFNSVGEYMGTVDSLSRIDGKLYMVDYKSSKNTWPEHFAQLAALWTADSWLVETSDMVWEDRKPEKMDGLALIHLRADKHEIIYVPEEDIGPHYDVFDGYNVVWRAKEKLKTNAKARETAKFGGF